MNEPSDNRPPILALDTVVRVIVQAHPEVCSGKALLARAVELSQLSPAWIWFALGVAVRGDVVAIKAPHPDIERCMFGLALVAVQLFPCPSCGLGIRNAQGHDCPQRG